LGREIVSENTEKLWLCSARAVCLRKEKELRAEGPGVAELFGM
jgi:hypothetical protein